MRISDLSSDVCSSDLLPAVRVIPKVDHVEQVFVVASLLRGKYPSILPMIEGARGLANAAQISAHAASVGLLFGGADLAGEMGIVPGWEALGYARSALVLACAQAGRDRKSTRLNSSH